MSRYKRSINLRSERRPEVKFPWRGAAYFESKKVSEGRHLDLDGGVEAGEAVTFEDQVSRKGREVPEEALAHWQAALVEITGLPLSEQVGDTLFKIELDGYPFSAYWQRSYGGPECGLSVLMDELYIQRKIRKHVNFALYVHAYKEMKNAERDDK